MNIHTYMQDSDPRRINLPADYISSMSDDIFIGVRIFLIILFKDPRSPLIEDY